jgi:hypothetical protein
MNKDRIQIDGVWYVREDNQNDEPIKLDVVETQGFVVENDNFCYGQQGLVMVKVVFMRVLILKLQIKDKNLGKKTIGIITIG